MATRFLSSLRRGWNRLVHKRALHDWDIREPLDVDWVSFACVCMRHELLLQVGGLDCGFFMYFEDNDWCMRARAAGWRIRFDPRLSITHIGGASLKQNPDAARAYRYSLKRLYMKHFPHWQSLIMRALLPIYARIAARSG